MLTKNRIQTYWLPISSDSRIDCEPLPWIVLLSIVVEFIINWSRPSGSDRAVHQGRELPGNGSRLMSDLNQHGTINKCRAMPASQKAWTALKLVPGHLRTAAACRSWEPFYRSAYYRHSPHVIATRKSRLSFCPLFSIIISVGSVWVTRDVYLY